VLAPERNQEHSIGDQVVTLNVGFMECLLKTYARIGRGIFVELIPPKPYDFQTWNWQEGQPSRVGEKEPIEDQYTAELFATMVDITDVSRMPQSGWICFDGVFAAPVPHRPYHGRQCSSTSSIVPSHGSNSGFIVAWRC